MLTIKPKDGEDEPPFNLLMELLRGEHWNKFLKLYK